MSDQTDPLPDNDAGHPSHPATTGETAAQTHTSSSAILILPPIFTTAGPIDPIARKRAPVAEEHFDSESSTVLHDDDEETIGATTPRGGGLRLPGEPADPYEFGDSDVDSAYEGESLLEDDTRSLASYITNYTYENGRRYHAYRDGSYWVCVRVLRILI